MQNSLLFNLLASIILVLFLSPLAQSQNLVTRAEVSETIEKEGLSVLSAVDYYEIDIDQLRNRLNESQFVEFEIPATMGKKTISLEKVNILSDGYKLYTSSGKSIDTANKYTFYQGSVKGTKDSKVTMVFYDSKVNISIFDGDGNYEIAKYEDLYAGYYDHNRKSTVDREWVCNMVDESSVRVEDNEAQSRSSSTPECVTVFFEVDHNMYNKQGSNITNAEAWVVTLFNQVSILYMEYDVPINISGIQVWDTPDPYVTSSNTSEALSLFRSAVYNNPNNNGRLAHLLSGRSLGGGIAYLNQLCSNSFNVAVSANLSSGSVPYPSYSWNVMVVAHEMGHNMGSNHTQACVWNGNNTAIDGCGTIEGSCADPGNPPNNVGGTIMSYCHLTSAGINLSNGFGPQPGNLIYERYSNASCETGGNCAFVSPFNDVCSRSKELPVLNYCVNGFYNNYATTSSGNGGNMSCGNSGDEKDIWYRFDYGNVDEIHLTLQATDGISDVVVELYTGECNALVSLECGFSINGDPISFSLDDPALVDEIIYIRVVEDGSDDEGEFSICIYSDDLPCQYQLDTLLNIYEDLNGSTWTDNQGWANGYTGVACDYCNWTGITCNYIGQITSIDLSNNNLQGPLPAELTALTGLNYLNLSNNALIDSIPEYWDSLDLLVKLDLSNNQFSGAIPTSFKTMTSINMIHLDFNELDSIPVGLGYNSSLRTFTASNNMLAGCFVNGISSFCYKDSINLSNNPGLPYAGDVSLLCENGWGTDWDSDGYCNEVEDCDDYDEDINPSADEVLCDAMDNNCNGTIDEGSDFGPNQWIGPDTLGIFEDPLNWSLGHIPTICENVEIGNNNETINLIILGNQSQGEGGGADGYGQLKVRNLIVGVNTTLQMGDTTNLSVLGNGVIENNGTLILYGYLEVRDQKGTNNTAIINNGVFSISGNGGFYIQDIGDFGVHNTVNGIMNLEGYSNINIYENELAKKAILNEGVINVHGYLSLSGTYMEEVFKNQNGGLINIISGGEFSVYK